MIGTARSLGLGGMTVLIGKGDDDLRKGGVGGFLVEVVVRGEREQYLRTWVAVSRLGSPEHANILEIGLLLLLVFEDLLVGVP